MDAPVTSAKPFVQVACICERVLVEPDNVASLIRIVDTYSVQIPSAPPPTGIPVVVPLTAFISLTSGNIIGDFEVGLRLHPPDNNGKEQPVRRWPVEFRGGEHGTNLKIAFILQDPKSGLYWFDVLWGDDVLTRIPFRLKSDPAVEPTGEAAAPNETVTH